MDSTGLSGAATRFLATVFFISAHVFSQEAGIERQSVPGSETVVLTTAQQQRLKLRSPLKRFAVAEPGTVMLQTVTSKEILIIAKHPGRTMITLWLESGEVKELFCHVQRDLTLLQSILTQIHAGIRAQIAPDRDAVVLSGKVTDITVSQAAELAATNYLAARETSGMARPVLLDSGTAGREGQAAAEANAGADRGPDGPGVSGLQAQTAKPPATFTLKSGNLGGMSDVRVINLLTLEHPPATMEDKIQQAIGRLAGKNVHIQRMVAGSVPDDRNDVFLLEGKLPNQVTLVRVLMLASRVVTGTNDSDSIQVAADESGGVNTGGTSGTQGGRGSGMGGGIGSGGMAGGMGGMGGMGAGMANRLRTNIARAKVLKAAGGRILSFIEVTDIPQVRVDIRLLEVNRTRLKSYSPNFTGLISSVKSAQLKPSGLAGTVETNPPAISGKSAVMEVLGFLGGTLSNQTQFTSGRFAVNSALSLLENLGIARSLSSPSLTVLSGETASFQAGGEIPVNQSYVAPIASGGTQGSPGGVYNSVQFIPFGVQLSVRPLVGEDDVVMMDLVPTISTPNAALTASITSATGAASPTVAFQTRSLQTSARLQDGQAMLLGGLLTRDNSETQGGTPGLKDVAGLGWMFKNLQRSDDGLELVIVVNPVIVRQPKSSLPVWDFPQPRELTPAALQGAEKSIEEKR